MLLADRLARYRLARSAEGHCPQRRGEVFLVVREVERWVNRAEALLAEAEKERRKPKRADLALTMSAEADG